MGKPRVSVSLPGPVSAGTRTHIPTGTYLLGLPSGPTGNSTGSGKPAVFGPRVARVRVRCPDLATRALPRTLTAGWRVSTGLQGTPSGRIFSTILQPFAHLMAVEPDFDSMKIMWT